MNSQFKLCENYPLYLAGERRLTGEMLEVTDKFTGDVVSRVSLADEAMIAQAFSDAEACVLPLRAAPAYQRKEWLLKMATQIRERAEELAYVMTVEVGKPIRDARGEVARMIDTFTTAAEEAVRLGGEILPMDAVARGKDYFGAWKRVPLGVCSFIVPFNFPFNLAAHKIAPALAVGCPFVLKPASYTPISGVLLGEMLAQCDLPKGAFSILPCRRGVGDRFVTDERAKLLSFTGSPVVGWEMKKAAGKKRVVLELGGNAACIVEPDAPLELAINKIAVGAFAQSGQSCISVQRVFVHREVYAKFKEGFLAKVKALKVGNPLTDSTDIGPLISEKDAVRLEQWCCDAVKQGAKILCGGKREGALLEATVLESVPRSHPLCAEEAFGPVVVLEAYGSFDEALDAVNATRFGLQAGVFTGDFQKSYRAWERLEVGGVMINETPTFRLDHMPYGGIKDSGLGREGVRFAMEDMTEIRMLVARINTSS